jgi:hypothetical protein
MRLKPTRYNRWRVAQALACLVLAAVCWGFLSAKTVSAQDPSYATLWACATLAAMAFVYFRKTR